LIAHETKTRAQERQTEKKYEIGRENIQDFILGKKKIKE
jgi:hypothetical protein